MKKIEDYTLAKQLEESNFALIYRAQDKDGKDLVLKVAKDAKPELNELISREFQILSQFQHPNIVSVYDYGMTDGRAYFTQEYIPDKPIQECFAGFSEEFLVAIIQVINALGAFHDKGFIHCDLKPEHILYNKDKKRAVLIDFGFAGTPTQGVPMAGTLGYMAPEVLKGVCIDQRSDLYSLGVIIYEIISGTPLTDPYEPIKDIPEDINKLLARLVAKEPLVRPNALELFQSFKQHITTIEVAEPLYKVNLPETGFVEIPEIAKRITNAQSEALVITGDTGTGKTRHLQELKYKYLMHGYAVLFHTAKEQTTLAQSMQNFIGLKDLGLKEIENKFQIFETINQALLTFAEGKDIAILVDGLEDLSDYGLQLFRYIGYGIKDAKIVLIGTAQPEQKIKELGFETMELRPFTKDETQTLLEKTFFAIADTKKMAQAFDFAAWLHKQSGGNPLYIVEILKSLYDQEVLHYRENQWQLASDKLEAIKLPTKLDGLLEARLHTLAERPLKILKILSLVDCPLDISVITDILGADVRVDIEHLKNIGFLREESVDSKRLLNIPNQILTQIVTRSLNKEEKQSLSKSITQPLETLVKKDDNYLPVLARLYDGIDDTEKAYDYFKRAAEKAKKLHDYDSAIQHYEELRELTTLVNTESRSEILSETADLLRIMGNNQSALEYYQEALQTNTQTLHSKLYAGLGSIYSNLENDAKAIESFMRALEAVDEHSAEYIYTANHLGYIYARQSRFLDAEKIFAKSLQISEELNDARATADTLYYQACIEWYRYDVDAGLEKASALFRFSKKHRLGKLTGYGSNLLSSFHAEKNNVEEAQKYLNLAINAFRETKNVDALCGALTSGVLIHMMTGQLYRAKHAAEDALFRSKQLSVKELRFVNTANLAAIHQDFGNFGIAISLGVEAISMKPDAILSNLNLAMVYLKQGNLDKGCQLLMQKNSEKPEILYCAGLALLQTNRGKMAEGQRMCNKCLALMAERNVSLADKANASLRIAQHYFESAKFKESASFAEKVVEITHRGSKENAIASAFLKLSKFNLAKINKINIGLESNRLKDIGCIYDYAYLKRLEIESLLRMDSQHTDMKKIIEDVTEIKEIFASIGANLELERTKKLQEKLFPLIAKDYSQRRISAQYLDTFSNLAELINSHLGDTGFTQNLLDLVVRTTNAERGAIFVKTTKGMKFVAGRDMDRTTIKDAGELSQTAIKELSKGRIVFAEDALSNPQFNIKKSVMLNQIRSLLCIPLSVSDNVIGAIYLDSKVASGIFGPQDKDFLMTVSKILASVVEKSMAFQSMSEENILLKSNIIREIGSGYLKGKSKVMNGVYKLIDSVAPTDSPVLIHGETGTGKGMVARLIHMRSSRKDKNFMSINCGTIPETLLESELFGHKKGAFTGAVADKKGLLEAGHGGTVFLDEISNTSLEFQGKLLEAIEEKIIRRIGETTTRIIDVRFLFATNKDLEIEIEDKRFRRDLFYRINVFSIEMPPLRDRAADIPLLAQFFLEKYSKELNKSIDGFTPDAMQQLREYIWSGNVRELQNVVERAVVLAKSGLITDQDVGFQKVRRPEIMPMKEIQREVIIEALNACGWNISKTARQLGIGRRTLHRYINKYGIVRDSTLTI